MEYLHEDKERKHDVSITFLDQKGECEYQGMAIMSGRGNGTWFWPKKPFNLDFSEPITIGSFENLNKLCLLSEYTDKSKLQNSLCFFLGEQLGIPYVSSYAYVDVYINGDYYGLCALATKEEYKRYIEEAGIQAVFEDSSSERGNQFQTAMDQTVRIRYGDTAEVEAIVERMERAITGSNVEELLSCIDVEAWALKYAMEEFLFNRDVGYASQYFYVGGDGLIRPMLPWDYEWVMESTHNIPDYGGQQELSVHRHPNSWYCQLLKYEVFTEAVYNHLQQKFTPTLFEAMDQHMVRDMKEMSGSWYCDRIRWKNTFQGAQVYVTEPSYIPEAYNNFNDFFENRLDFLLEYFSQPESYRQIRMKYNMGGILRDAGFHLVVLEGTTFQEWQELIYDSTEYYVADGFHGWFTEDGTPLEELGIVTENTVLYEIFDTPPIYG